MIEFTWTATLVESRLWAEALQRFSVAGLRAGTLLARLGEVEPYELAGRAILPAGTTDVDLAAQVLRARPEDALLTDILAEPGAEAAGIGAMLELTDPGRVVSWDRDQPLIGLPAHIRRAGRMVDTVGFVADCLDTRQGEWDVVRSGWLSRLLERGWQPSTLEFLTAALTGFLAEYERLAAPQMGQVLPVEPLSPHPRVREAWQELRRTAR